MRLILSRLGIDDPLRDVVELECGHGTFSIPIARSIRGTLCMFDVEATAATQTTARCDELPAEKLICQFRDVMEQGFVLRLRLQVHSSSTVDKQDSRQVTCQVLHALMEGGFLSFLRCFETQQHNRGVL